MKNKSSHRWETKRDYKENIMFAKSQLWAIPRNAHPHQFAEVEHRSFTPGTGTERQGHFGEVPELIETFQLPPAPKCHSDVEKWGTDSQPTSDQKGGGRPREGASGVVPYPCHSSA